VLTGLCIGAIAVYTPEEGITLDQLQADINHLKRSFALDRGENRMGKIFLRNEKASEKAYTTEIISNIIREEAKGRFEARTAVPGHVQQGGNPRPEPKSFQRQALSSGADIKGILLRWIVCVRRGLLSSVVNGLRVLMSARTVLLL